MSLFATPKRSSYATRQCSFALKNENFEFDFSPAPQSVPNMKVEMDDDYGDHGAMYAYTGQIASAPSSATSSFYASDFNPSPPPASATSFNGSFKDPWQPMTPGSSRRPSLDPSFDIHGLSSSPAYGVPAYCNNSNNNNNNNNSLNAMPYRNLQYTTPLSRSRSNMSIESFAPPSICNSMYSEFSQSFPMDPSSALIYLDNSPHFPLSQSFIDPSQTTFLQPCDLSTPFQTPVKQPTQNPFDSFCDNSQPQHVPYFMSPTPSHSSSPSRASAKRRRGDSQASTTSSQPEEHDLNSSFCSSASFSSTSSSASHTSNNTQDTSMHKLVAERPKFFCDWPTCPKNPNSPACVAPRAQDSMGFRSGVGFKRQEHLKRHMSTHTEPKDLRCKFCQEEGKESKRWIKGRNDNFKAHLHLHIKNADGKKKGTRTTYRPEAAMLLKWLEKQQGAKKQSKKRKADANDEDVNAKEERDDVATSSEEDRKMAEIVQKYWMDDDDKYECEM